jgi:hypothetical protein
MKTLSPLILAVAMFFSSTASATYGGWSVSMGQTMTMNSAICNQAGNCGKLTDEQKQKRKIITDQALECITAAHRRYGQGAAREQAVASCKAIRDRGYASIRTGGANKVSVSQAPIDFSLTDYRVSAKVTDEMRKRLQDGLRSVPNSLAQQQLVLRIDFEAVFDSAMRKHGLRSGNLADAMAGYWLTMWSIVNRSQMPNTAAISGVRTQMAQLAAQAGVAKVSDAEKQREAQKLIWQTVLALSAQRTNGQNSAALAAEMNKVARKQGMDLARMQITQSGFTPR